MTFSLWFHPILLKFGTSIHNGSMNTDHHNKPNSVGGAAQQIDGMKKQTVFSFWLTLSENILIITIQWYLNVFINCLHRNKLSNLQTWSALFHSTQPGPPRYPVGEIHTPGTQPEYVITFLVKVVRIILHPWTQIGIGRAQFDAGHAGTLDTFAFAGWDGKMSKSQEGLLNLFKHAEQLLPKRAKTASTHQQCGGRSGGAPTSLMPLMHLPSPFPSPGQPDLIQPGCEWVGIQ